MMEHPASTSHADLPWSVGGSDVCSISAVESRSLIRPTSWLPDEIGRRISAARASSMSVEGAMLDTLAQAVKWMGFVRNVSKKAMHRFEMHTDSMQKISSLERNDEFL